MINKKSQHSTEAVSGKSLDHKEHQEPKNSVNSAVDDYRTWVELLTHFPGDAKLNDLDEWFRSAQAAGKDSQEMFGHIKTWRKDERLPADVRRHLHLYLQSDPGERFHLLTEELSEHPHPDARQLEEWWSSGLKAKVPHGSLVKQLETWKDMKAWPATTLEIMEDLVRQQWIEKDDPRPSRHSTLRIAEENSRPINIGAANVIKRGWDRDDRSPKKKRKKIA